MPLKVQADIGGLSPLSSYFQKSPDKKIIWVNATQQGHNHV